MSATKKYLIKKVLIPFVCETDKICNLEHSEFIYFTALIVCR